MPVAWLNGVTCSMCGCVWRDSAVSAPGIRYFGISAVAILRMAGWPANDNNLPSNDQCGVMTAWRRRQCGVMLCAIGVTVTWPYYFAGGVAVTNLAYTGRPSSSISPSHYDCGAVWYWLNGANNGCGPAVLIRMPALLLACGYQCSAIDLWPASMFLTVVFIIVLCGN